MVLSNGISPVDTEIAIHKLLTLSWCLFTQLPILLVVFDLWQALRPLKKSPRTGWIIRLAFFIIFVDVMWFHLIAESHFGVNATTWWVERGHIILDAMGISCTIYATAFLASRSSMFSKRHLLGSIRPFSLVVCFLQLSHIFLLCPGMPARDGSPQIPLLLASSDEAVIEAVQLQISGWGKCELKLVQSFKKLRMALKQTHFVAIFIVRNNLLYVLLPFRLLDANPNNSTVQKDAELPGFDVAHISDLTPLLGIASSGTTNPTMVYIIADKSIIPSHAQLGTSKVYERVWVAHCGAEIVIEINLFVFATPLPPTDATLLKSQSHLFNWMLF
jgi:hypothetical protein